MIRGGIYLVDLGKPFGHEQGGKRPAVAISQGGWSWSVTTIIPTSTSAQSTNFRPEIIIDGVRTRLLVDQIRTIDVRRIVGNPIDHLDHFELRDLEWTLCEYLGLLAKGISTPSSEL